MTTFRHFYVKSHGITDPEQINLKDLPGSSGRLDVVARCINSAFWLSNAIRKNVVFHTILHGEPAPPIYIRLEGARLRKVSPDERNISIFLKKALERRGDEETTPGIFASRKSFEEVVEENKDKEFYLLDKDGIKIKDVKFEGNPFFFLGDNHDLTEEEKQFLIGKGAKSISLGKVSYLSSHCIAILNWWLDRIQE
ncbi:MAG: tRNA (pseudouridine(54)-N(1))-methyltransferase TrmY [Candidatus Thermoplasmatota archaeon]|nr:tRNA (pseudouridine(54)-N(1))-methyltransferase TrmY [Candidatus Thermoplasmatota archaeon]